MIPNPYKPPGPIARSVLRDIARHPVRELLGRYIGSEAEYKWLLLRSVRRVASVLDAKPSDVSRFVEELYQDSSLWSAVGQKFESARSLDPDLGGWMPGPLLGLLYAAIRARRPERIVETGVGAGSTSAVILRAIERNDCGSLTSIDLPEGDVNMPADLGRKASSYHPAGWTNGWIIPESLRPRWRLIVGDAKTELPRLLVEFGRIDFFLHDSLHTYEHMRFEYRAALDHLSPGGVLASDDVGQNPAFSDFCSENRLRSVLLGDRLGFARGSS